MEGLHGFGVLTHARCCSQLPTGSSPGEPGDFVPGQPVPVRASVVSADRLPGTAGEEDETRARFALPVVMEPVELAVLFRGECLGFKNDRPAVDRCPPSPGMLPRGPKPYRRTSRQPPRSVSRMPV